MKIFLSFVKLIDNTIHVGVSETTEDRFEHSDGISDQYDLGRFLNENAIFGIDVPVMWSTINLALHASRASLVEYVVNTDH